MAETVLPNSAMRHPVSFLENVNLLRGELLAARAQTPRSDVVVIGGEERIPYVYMMDRPKVMKIADDTTFDPQTAPGRMERSRH